MVQTEVEIIRRSFNRVAPSAPLIGELFYKRLTETAPDIVLMFGDYFDSGSKFQVVSEVVNRHLRSLLSVPVTPGGQKPPIPPAVYQLGQRHVKYAVTGAQFAKMKEALLWTLEQFLGPDFSPETRDAWSRAYDNLADMIQRAMAQPEKPEKYAFLRAENASSNEHLEDAISRLYGRILAD